MEKSRKPFKSLNPDSWEIVTLGNGKKGIGTEQSPWIFYAREIEPKLANAFFLCPETLECLKSLSEMAEKNLELFPKEDQEKIKALISQSQDLIRYSWKN